MEGIWKELECINPILVRLKMGVPPSLFSFGFPFKPPQDGVVFPLEPPLFPPAENLPGEEFLRLRLLPSGLKSPRWIGCLSTGAGCARASLPGGHAGHAGHVGHVGHEGWQSKSGFKKVETCPCFFLGVATLCACFCV